MFFNLVSITEFIYSDMGICIQMCKDLHKTSMTHSTFCDLEIVGNILIKGHLSHNLCFERPTNIPIIHSAPR